MGTMKTKRRLKLFSNFLVLFCETFLFLLRFFDPILRFDIYGEDTDGFLNLLARLSHSNCVTVIQMEPGTAKDPNKAVRDLSREIGDVRIRLDRLERSKKDAEFEINTIIPRGKKNCDQKIKFLEVERERLYGEREATFPASTVDDELQILDAEINVLEAELDQWCDSLSFLSSKSRVQDAKLILNDSKIKVFNDELLALRVKLAKLCRTEPLNMCVVGSSSGNCFEGKDFSLEDGYLVWKNPNGREKGSPTLFGSKSTGALSAPNSSKGVSGDIQGFIKECNERVSGRSKS